MCYILMMTIFFQPLLFSEINSFSLNFINFSISIKESLYSLSNFLFFNNDKPKKESIFSRSENLFFLFLPLLYFYLSNMVKLSQLFTTGTITGTFSDIENRYIWFSIIGISINIIVHDIFY